MSHTGNKRKSEEESENKFQAHRYLFYWTRASGLGMDDFFRGGGKSGRCEDILRG
jgi:hypothetical protein